MEYRFNPRTTFRRPAISRLDAHLCYWVRCVSNQISHSLSRELEDKGITLAEWIVLRELYDGARRPSAVAAKLGLTRGAISKLASRLSNALMITQERTREDGRGRMLALSGLGRSMVEVLAVVLDDDEEQFFGHLEPNTRALIMNVMRDIVRRRGLRTLPAA